MNRTLPIHQSLHRHAHVLGAEREPVMTSALIALLVGVGGLIPSCNQSGFNVVISESGGYYAPTYTHP